MYQDRKRRKLFYSSGMVRLGLHQHLLKVFPLVNVSGRITKAMESAPIEKDSVVIDLPDCPGSPEIFKVVDDFSYGLLEDKAISISNAIELMTVCDFLEMDSLASDVMGFVESHVLVSTPRCLSVLQTAGGLRMDTVEKNSVFSMCKDKILRYISVKHWPERLPGGCVNSTCEVSWEVLLGDLKGLRRVGKVLPPDVATHIFQTCRARGFGLCAARPHESGTGLEVHIPVCSRVEDCCVKSQTSESITFFPIKEGASRDWAMDLRCSENEIDRDYPFIVHLAKSMRFKPDDPHQFRLNWRFLCALLVEAVKLRTWITARLLLNVDLTPGIGKAEYDRARDIEFEIEALLKMVVRGLADVTACGSKQKFNTDPGRILNQPIINCLRQFDFDSLQTVVERFGRECCEHVTICSVADMIDVLVKDYLKSGKCTVNDAFSIYEKFPNSVRRHHSGIYHAFEDSLKKGSCFAKDMSRLGEILDFGKLPGEIVEKFFRQALRFDIGRKLLKKFRMAEHGGLQDKLMVTFMAKRHQKTIKEIEDLRKELRQQTEQSKSAESELNETKQKITCQICFDRPRDTLCFPCTHFLYCSDCLKKQRKERKTCPACRGPLNSLLRCCLSL